MTDTDPVELVNYGKTLEAHREWELAQNIYSHFIRQETHRVAGFIGLARVFDAQNKSELALAALEDGWNKTKNPEIKQALVSKYESMLEKSDQEPMVAFEVAARTIESGIDLDRAISVLIQYASRLKKQVEAATLLEQLLPLRPDEDIDILHACAKLYSEVGEKQKARDIITYMMRR